MVSTGRRSPLHRQQPQPRRCPGTPGFGADSKSWKGRDYMHQSYWSPITCDRKICGMIEEYTGAVAFESLQRPGRIYLDTRVIQMSIWPDHQSLIACVAKSKSSFVITTPNRLGCTCQILEGPPAAESPRGEDQTCHSEGARPRIRNLTHAAWKEKAKLCACLRMS